MILIRLENRPQRADVAETSARRGPDTRSIIDEWFPRRPQRSARSRLHRPLDDHHTSDGSNMSDEKSSPNFAINLFDVPFLTPKGRLLARDIATTTLNLSLPTFSIYRVHWRAATTMRRWATLRH